MLANDQITHMTDCGPACSDCDSFVEGEGIWGYARRPGETWLWTARCAACNGVEDVLCPTLDPDIYALRRAHSGAGVSGCDETSHLRAASA